MIFTVFSVLIVLYGLIDFKKSFLIFVIYHVFWYSTKLFEVGGMAMNTTILVCGGYCVLFFFNKKKYKKIGNFPYKVPFVLIMASYLLSSFTALSGFGTEFARGVRIILLPYSVILILWKIADDKKDFVFLFRGITVVMFISCIYGIIEYFLGKNILLDYKIMLSGGNLDVYEVNTLRGYRLTSIFEHPLGAGMTFGLYSAFVFVTWLRMGIKLPYRRLAIITAILCLPCIILTKMRSGILFTIICFLPVLDLKKITRKRAVVITIGLFLGIPLLLILMRNQLYIITNLFTVSKSSAVGGSSLEMRLNQLTAVTRIFSMSPITGLGQTFRAYITRSIYTDAALGYESIWFEQLTMHGLIGVCAQIVLLYMTVFKVPKKYNSKPALIFSIAYWVTYTLTSIPSFRVVLFYAVMIFFIKHSDKYRPSSINEHKNQTILAHLRG